MKTKQSNFDSAWWGGRAPGLTVVLLGFLFALGTSAFAADQRKATGSQLSPVQESKPAEARATAPLQIELECLSVQGSGATFVTGGGLQLGFSVAQSVAGAQSAATRKLGIGFWGACAACALLGDLNGDLVRDIVDIVAMINYVVFGDPVATGLICADLTGDGVVDISDIICLINNVVFSNPIPCL